MLFNSYPFVLWFLPVTLVGYFLLNKIHVAAGKMFLLGMSLWFFAWFNWKYLPILLASIVVNYLAAYLLQKARGRGARRAVMAVALLFNIGMLFYYKYYDFFVENLNAALGTGFVLHNIVVPVGISFFTFQQIAYILDNYWELAPAYSLLDYALYIAFFPKLLSGPIATHDEMIPQFVEAGRKRFDVENFSKGLLAFAFGLAKKVLLADVLGTAVDWGYGALDTMDATNGLLVMLAYTLQMYFDFSGYCDMAGGVSLMLNIDLPKNFNSPYRAKTIREYWERWHITLTRFFQKYLFIPLSRLPIGNKRSKVRGYVLVFIVFLVSGIWHGANWTFIVWGVLHGLASVVNAALAKPIKRIPGFISWFFTFLFVNVALVFFRAASLSQAGQMLGRVFSFSFGPVQSGLLEAFYQPEWKFAAHLLGNEGGLLQTLMPYAAMALLLCFGMFAVLAMKNTDQRLVSFKPGAGISLVTAVLLVWSILSFSGVSTFLYFDF